MACAYLVFGGKLQVAVLRHAVDVLCEFSPRNWPTGSDGKLIAVHGLALIADRKLLRFNWRYWLTNRLNVVGRCIRRNVPTTSEEDHYYDHRDDDDDNWNYDTQDDRGDRRTCNRQDNRSKDGRCWLTLLSALKICEMLTLFIRDCLSGRFGSVRV